MAGMSPAELQALRLSLEVAGTSVFCSLPVALCLSWVLGRKRFPGRRVLDAVVHLPLVLPPVAVGYLLLMMFGSHGVIGAWLLRVFGVQLVFTRAGAALARAAGCKVPIYRLMFSETFAYGFPPKPYALAAHVELINEEAPGAPWMIAGLGVDIRPLIQEAVRRGGHIRVGLEDAPFGCPMTNPALLEEAVKLVRVSGAEPATVAEMRADLTIATDRLRITARETSTPATPPPKHFAGSKPPTTSLP